MEKMKPLKSTAQHMWDEMGKEAKVSDSASENGLCCVPIKEERHYALENLYQHIGGSVKPGGERDELLRLANRLNSIFNGK